MAETVFGPKRLSLQGDFYQNAAQSAISRFRFWPRQRLVPEKQPF